VSSLTSLQTRTMQRALDALALQRPAQIKVNSYNAADLCHLALAAHAPGEEAEDPNLPPVDKVPPLTALQHLLCKLSTTCGLI
jgi:hypothetical protein